LVAGSAAAPELKGVPSVVICPKCGNIEVKPVVDIRKTRCSKCGAREWFAVGCAKCGKIFPFDETKLDDSDLDDPDAPEAIEKCPHCGSSDILPVTPANLKAWKNKKK
jgi:NAD-dependent SIR2 family protein deacetylase